MHTLVHKMLILPLYQCFYQQINELMPLISIYKTPNSFPMGIKKLQKNGPLKSIPLCLIVSEKWSV